MTRIRIRSIFCLIMIICIACSPRGGMQLLVSQPEGWLDNRMEIIDGRNFGGLGEKIIGNRVYNIIPNSVGKLTYYDIEKKEQFSIDIPEEWGVLHHAYEDHLTFYDLPKGNAYLTDLDGNLIRSLHCENAEAYAKTSLDFAYWSELPDLSGTIYTVTMHEKSQSEIHLCLCDSKTMTTIFPSYIAWLQPIIVGPNTVFCYGNYWEDIIKTNESIASGQTPEHESRAEYWVLQLSDRSARPLPIENDAFYQYHDASYIYFTCGYYSIGEDVYYPLENPPKEKYVVYDGALYYLTVKEQQVYWIERDLETGIESESRVPIAETYCYLAYEGITDQGKLLLQYRETETGPVQWATIRL